MSQPKMADLVDDILRKAAEKTDKFKSIEVHKNLELDFDVGNLLAVDNNPIDLQNYRSDPEVYLRNIARDNTQLLINKIWKLPVERVQDAIVAKIPAPMTILPREKPAPKRRPKTKWEQYARTKGIKKKKKSNLVWDEVLKEWKPRWGYKHAQAEQGKNWLIEVPANADPYEDQFAKRAGAKKERVAKNEYQRLRNIARANKIPMPKVGIAPTEKQSKDQVGKAITLAKAATASLGKFSKSVANEKPSRKCGKKRKFEPLFGNVKDEQQRSLSLLRNLSSKKPKLDLSRAVNQQIVEEDKEQTQQRKKIPKRRSKAGERKGGKNRGKGKNPGQGKKKKGKA